MKKRIRKKAYVLSVITHIFLLHMKPLYNTHMKATELSIGNSIKLNGKIWKVTDKMHVKPGKGGAYLQTTLKSLDGTKLEHRFSSSDTVELVSITKRACHFSYQEKGTLFFTDDATYETIEVTADTISKHSFHLVETYASEEMNLDIEFADDAIIDVLLPTSIAVEVETADPVVKGQTAASSYKNATIKGGIKIGVPPYIDAGDKIIINPYAEKGNEFVERVK